MLEFDEDKLVTGDEMIAMMDAICGNEIGKDIRGIIKSTGDEYPYELKFEWGHLCEVKTSPTKKFMVIPGFGQLTPVHPDTQYAYFEALKK